MRRLIYLLGMLVSVLLSGACDAQFTGRFLVSVLMPGEYINLDIALMNPDGTNLQYLITTPAAEDNPVLSPDGQKLAFIRHRSCGNDVLIMNVDGTDLIQLTPDEGCPWNVGLTWSPDGTQVAFSRYTSIDEIMPTDDYDIIVANADGTGWKNLTQHWAVDQFPTWSPDGTRIAFSSGGRDENDLGNGDIYVMNPDGTDITRLTFHPELDLAPQWSPDGTRIQFYSYRDDPVYPEVYVMNRDGSDKVNLSQHPQVDYSGFWSPDGTQILFESARDGGHPNQYIMDVDGGNLRKLELDEGIVVHQWLPNESVTLILPNSWGQIKAGQRWIGR
ncbi:hypothetical protein HN588_15650 [Candidatus Bathyarchaeota archaeon]|nr:hypothetical protein [Candidatus Bathyarchaeota archaeon]